MHLEATMPPGRSEKLMLASRPPKFTAHKCYSGTTDPDQMHNNDDDGSKFAWLRSPSPGKQAAREARLAARRGEGPAACSEGPSQGPHPDMILPPPAPPHTKVSKAAKMQVPTQVQTQAQEGEDIAGPSSMVEHHEELIE